MPELRTLSVDTNYDASLSWFREARRDLYKDLVGSHNIDPLSTISANKGQMFKRLFKAEENGKPYSAVVISSHGQPGVVLDNDSPDEILFSVDDDNELLRAFNNKTIYLCCCKSALDGLPEKLVTLGANLVIGFTESPKWETTDGARMWKKFDLEMVECAIFGQGPAAFERERDQFLDRIYCKLQTPSASIRADFNSMQSVLSTMIILPKGE